MQMLFVKLSDCCSFVKGTYVHIILSSISKCVPFDPILCFDQEGKRCVCVCVCVHVLSWMANLCDQLTPDDQFVQLINNSLLSWKVTDS